MTSSRTLAPVSSSGSRPLSRREIAYYQQRLRNRAFEAVLAYFEQRAVQEGLTKKELARRLGKDPSQITRWFSGPGNWTLDTVSDLLLAMGAEPELAISTFESMLQDGQSPTAEGKTPGNARTRQPSKEAS